jgi:hypothetical protein
MTRRMSLSLSWILGLAAAAALLGGCVAYVDPYPRVYVPVPRVVVAPAPVVVAPRPWGWHRWQHHGYGWHRHGYR